MSTQTADVTVCPGVRLLDHGDGLYDLPATVTDFPETLRVPVYWRNGIHQRQAQYITFDDGLLIIRCATTSAVYRQTTGHPDEFTRIA